VVPVVVIIKDLLKVSAPPPLSLLFVSLRVVTFDRSRVRDAAASLRRARSLKPICV
jgi:hypothetical protein